MLKANCTKDFKSKFFSTFLRVLMMTTIFIILGCKDKSELENTKTGTEEETETEIEEEEEEENTETGNEESEEENIENEGLASQYPGDANIKEDSKVIFASGFEDGFEGWTKYNDKVSEIKADSENANFGSRYLQTTATRGVDTGGDVVFKLPEGVDQLYLRFYTKFHENTVMPHHFVKIRAFYPDPYWGNAGQRPKGDEAFWTGIEPINDRTWNFYTYWHEMHSWQTTRGDPDPEKGDKPYYGNVFRPASMKSFERDEWICVEAMMKANTPGESNGELAFWINGVKQGEWKRGSPDGVWKNDKFINSISDDPESAPFEGFNFRSDNRVKISEISLQWYVSKERAQEGATDKNIIFFDDVVIATEYIGPKE